MKTQPRVLLLTLFATSIFAHIPSAEAGWSIKKPLGDKPLKKLERMGQQLGDAAKDVGTLGEHGRARDRERARQDEEKARIQREAAEKLKAEKRSALQKNLADYEQMKSGLANIQTYVDTALSELANVKGAAQQVMANASWWDRHGLPRISDLWANDSDSAAEAITILEVMLYQNAQTRGFDPLAEGQVADPTLERTKTQNTIEFARQMQEGSARLKALAENSKREMQDLLAEALGRVGYAKAESLLLGVQSTENSLAQAKAYADSLAGFYEKAALDAKAALEALDAKPEPAPAPAQAPAPAPAEKRQLPNRQEFDRDRHLKF